MCSLQLIQAGWGLWGQLFVKMCVKLSFSLVPSPALASPGSSNQDNVINLSEGGKHCLSLLKIKHLTGNRRNEEAIMFWPFQKVYGVINCRQQEAEGGGAWED